MKIPHELLYNIKVVQAKKNLSNKELADRTGLNGRTIEYIRSGKASHRESTIILICDVLDVDYEKYLFRDESLNSQNIKATSKLTSRHNLTVF